MDQQVPEQEQDDSEYCTCDACARELRQASEKEALETAAKQRLTVSLFDPTCCFFFPHLFSFTSMGPSRVGRVRGSGSRI